jgi:alginate production protein
MITPTKKIRSTARKTASKKRYNRHGKSCSALRVTGMFCLFLVSSQLPGYAQKKFGWIDFIVDNKPHASKEINAYLSFGVTLDLDAETAKNRNLDVSDDEDEDEFQTSVKLGFFYDNKAHLTAYSEFELSHEIAINRFKNNTPGTKLEINEAYVIYHSLDKNLAFTLGRWAVSDEREWLFDEEMDGAQFSWRGETLAFEAMYAREQLFPKDLLGDHDDNEPDYYFTRLSMRMAKQSTASIYGLAQQSRTTKDPDLYWLGGSLSGKAKNDIEYWAEAATVRGTEKGRDVRGYGMDVGVTKKFKNMSWEPRLTAAFAFGSGDDGAGTDMAYRQTGIQGNQGRFGGSKSFNYYGEVFDPELSNLGIITLGVGYDLKNGTSVDFVYHNYFQHRASKSIRKSNLDAKPSGNNRQLGNELDIIVGYRGRKSFKADLALGVFVPGAAFTNNDDAAWFIGIEFEKKF